MDKDVEKGINATKSTSTIAGLTYNTITASTPPIIQTKAAPNNTDRWSNVDSVITWKAKDRAAMYWAKTKGQFSSVFHMFGKKSNGEDQDVGKVIKHGTYTSKDCVTRPASSSPDHGEYMISGARAIPLPVEEASPVDIPHPQSPLPVNPEPALVNGHGLGLMDRYWKTTGKFLDLGKWSRTNIV